MNAMNTSRFARRAFALTGAAALAVGLAGCNNAGEGALSGAGIGAAAGAILGSLSGNAGTGAAIGAVIGGVGGGVMGDQNDRRSQPYSGNYSRRDW